MPAEPGQAPRAARTQRPTGSATAGGPNGICSESIDSIEGVRKTHFVRPRSRSRSESVKSQSVRYATAAAAALTRQLSQLEPPT